MAEPRKYSYRRVVKTPDEKVVKNLNNLAEATTYQKKTSLENATYKAALVEKADLQFKLSTIEALVDKKPKLVKRLKELDRFIDRIRQLESVEQEKVEQLLNQANADGLQTDKSEVHDTGDDAPDQVSVERLTDFT